jgi:hypothetical protein
MPTTDRRRARSARPCEAIRLLLECARERLGVRTLTLATSAGRVVAGAGEDLDRVAALGAAVDGGRAPDGGDGRRVATWRLRIGEDDLVLTSHGRAMDPDLGGGVRRILAA